MPACTLSHNVVTEYRRRLFEGALHIPRNVAMRYASNDSSAVATSTKYANNDTALGRDDLEQIGRLELLCAAEEWPGSGSFELYAWIRVRRAAVDEIRRVLGTGATGRGKTRQTDITRALDAIVEEVDKKRRSSAEQVSAVRILSCDDIGQQDAHAVMDAVSTLPRVHRFVLIGRACGMKQHELATQLGRTESRVNQIEREARLMLGDVKEAA